MDFYKVFRSNLIEKEKQLPEHITASVVSFRMLYPTAYQNIYGNARSIKVFAFSSRTYPTPFLPHYHHLQPFDLDPLTVSTLSPQYLAQ